MPQRAEVDVTGVVLECVFLRHRRQRQQARLPQRAAQVHLAQALVDDPEASSRWYRIYASTLRDALKDANLVGRGQKARGEIMANLTGAEWSMLITRELKANEWFDAANGEAMLTQATLPRTAPADPKAAAPARAAPGNSQPQASAPSLQPEAVTPALAAHPQEGCRGGPGRETRERFETHRSRNAPSRRAGLPVLLVPINAISSSFPRMRESSG